MAGDVRAAASTPMVCRGGGWWVWPDGTNCGQDRRMSPASRHRSRGASSSPRPSGRDPRTVCYGTASRTGRATFLGSTFLGSIMEYDLTLGDQATSAVDADWVGSGLHAAGEEVAWAVDARQAYALPPEGSSG